VYRYYAIGTACALAAAGAINLAKAAVISIFSPNEATFALVSALVVLALVYEPGRCINTIVIPALKGAGDVRFPVFVGIPLMWGIGVLGGYLLGVRMHLGLVGIVAGMAVDEWTRGIVMLFRWRSGAWKAKALMAKG
jgi:Na+-driven multidrug efflux pump